MEKELAPQEDSLELVQKRKVRRFKLSNVFSWILDGFSLDHGAFYTLKNLVYRPGEMVRSYLYQGRLDFTPPIRLLLVTTTLVLIAFQYSSVNQFAIESVSGTDGNASQTEFAQNYMQILEDYTNVFLWLLIPVLALFTWLFNRKSKFNYENLVLNTYYTVFANISYMMFFADKWVDNSYLTILYLLINVFHYLLCLKGMFQLTWFKSIWQSLVILVLSIISYSIILVLLMAALIIIGFFTPPS
jgi:hypothetical protein